MFCRRSSKNPPCSCYLREISTISIEKVAPYEKVTPSEEVEKGNNVLNDMEEPVVTIRRKDLDNFQGKS